MKKIIYLILTLQLLSSSVFSQAPKGTFNLVTGKTKFNDSLWFSKYKNNNLSDSLLITDVDGKLKQVSKKTVGCPDSTYMTPDSIYRVRVNCFGVIKDSSYIIGGIAELAGIDSLRRLSGSRNVEALKNGVWTTQFLDSVAVDSQIFNSTTFNWSVIDSINTPIIGIDSAIIGSTYLVGTFPIGEFVGQANKIATRSITYTWSFSAPSVGDYILNNKTAFVSQWNGTNWVRVSKAIINAGGNSYGIPLTVGSSESRFYFKTK
jgi:hypothetical protein